MDPCSIPALAIAVGGIALNAGLSLARFIDASQNAHSTWRGFHEEIKALGTVLDSISRSLEKRRVAESRHEEQHWDNVRTSLFDCQRSLQTFQTRLDRIKVDDAQLFAKPLQQFKLYQNNEAMTALRNQIVSYRDTLQVSLQVISMLSTQKTEGSVAKLSAKLDTLSVTIHQVRTHLQNQPIAEDGVAYPPPLFESSLPSYESATNDKDVKKNLENCIKSAERVWSTASEALANSTIHGSIDGLSVIGAPLSPKATAEIDEWVHKCSTDERDQPSTDDSVSTASTSNHTHERESYIESLSSVADDIDFKDDGSCFNAEEEMCHIESCEAESAACMEAGDYSAAEDAQKEAMFYLERRHTRQSTQFKNKNDMLEVLARIYYKQGKLDKAAKTLRVLAMTEECPPDRPWKWQHTLAEVYLELNHLDHALKCCAAAKRGREKEHGTKNRLFLESIALSAKIYELKGETRIVKTWQKLYPGAFVSQQHEEKRQESVALLKENGFDCSSENWDPAKGVEWAASQGQVQAVQFLFKENEGETTASQRLGTKALVSAASSGNMEILEMALEKSGNVNATNSEGSTALLLAVQNGHEAAVRLLLEKRANVGAVDRHKRRTALHFATNEEIAKMLIQKGADIEAMDCNKRRPLHLAAEKGEKTVAKVLLKNGAEIHARDDSWKTALHIAISKGHLQVVELLFGYGATGDLALVGIAKGQSNSAISKLVEEKVKQHEKEEKEKKKRQKEKEKETKAPKDRKPSSGGGLNSFLRRKTTAF